MIWQVQLRYYFCVSFLKIHTMKKRLNILLAVFAFGMLSVATSYAQTKKIAVLNTEKIFSLMPEKPSADSAVYKYQEELYKELAAKQKVLQEKFADFEAKKDGYSATMKDLKQKELQEDNARLEEFYTTIESELVEKQSKVYKPITDKIINAAKEVAKEKGYSYVMDANSFIYFDETDVIDAAVKAKLGLK